jgi:hypothetical protein
MARIGVWEGPARIVEEVPIMASRSCRCQTPELSEVQLLRHSVFHTESICLQRYNNSGFLACQEE